MKRTAIAEIIKNVVEGNQLHEIGSDVTIDLDSNVRMNVFRSVGHKGAGLKRNEVYVTLEHFGSNMFGDKDWRMLGISGHKSLPPNVIPVHRAATIISNYFNK